jgi:hypothetical protein
MSPGVDAPHKLPCGKLYDYCVSLCDDFMKRNVGGVFCFLEKTKKKQLDLLRLGVRTAGLPEVEAEADKRSGSSGQAAT